MAITRASIANIFHCCLVIALLYETHFIDRFTLVQDRG